MLYFLGYLRNDTAAMQREVEWSRGKPAEGSFLRYEAFAAAACGRFREAAGFNERGDAIAERNRTPVEVAVARAGVSLRAASVGNLANALSLADTAASFPDASGNCLMTYAIAGDQRRFERLLPRFVSNPPVDLKGFDVAPFTSLAKGVLQLKRGMAEDAVQTLRAAAAYEKAARYQMLPPYWRGYALVAAKRPTDAISEFQTILSHRPLAGMQWPLAHVGLARAYAAAGNVAASRKAYEDFFALWKDADADVPILVEAKKEHAALK
jgi:predicted Zn-dependent protease